MFEINKDNRDTIKYKALFFLAIGFVIGVTGLLFWGMALFIRMGDDSKLGAARSLFCFKAGGFFGIIGLIVIIICIFAMWRVKLSIQKDDIRRS